MSATVDTNAYFMVYCLYLVIIYMMCCTMSVEVQQRELFLTELRALGDPDASVEDTAAHHLSPEEVETLVEKFDTSSMQKDTLKDIIDASLSTFLLHVESRVASSQGLGEIMPH